MIVYGKQIAEELLRLLEGERTQFRDIRLGILFSGGDAATQSYVRIKTTMAERLSVMLSREELNADASTDDAVAAMKRLVHECDGVIVQLPLPTGIDTGLILGMVHPKLDVDGINPTIREDKRLVKAPVAEAIEEIFSRTGVNARGKKAIVIGEGRLVGKPAAYLLHHLGATVSVITQTNGSLADLKNADVIISGAGEPGLITPHLIKQGVVLIDAGTSEAGGKVAGDADPACAQVASVFTPVPGGIGPIAVAMIFKNLFTLARLAQTKLK